MRKSYILLCERAPSWIDMLLCDQVIKVEVFVKLVRLGSRVTEEPLLIQFFRSLTSFPSAYCGHREAETSTYIKNLLRRHMKQTRTRLLQVNRGQG